MLLIEFIKIRQKFLIHLQMRFHLAIWGTLIRYCKIEMKRKIIIIKKKPTNKH